MNEADALDIVQAAIWTVVVASGPPVLAAMAVGLIVALIQALTQVQEMTLTYVPKIIGVGLVIMFFGSWMLTTLVSFTRLCFESAARVMIG